MEQYKEINGIGYTLVGDYYLPNLLLHQEAERPVGVWGRRRMDYLKKHRRVLFTNLMTGGGLNAHLADTDERAREMNSPLVEQMVASEDVTEELKARNQMAWVGRMDNIAARAREIVCEEVIYDREARPCLPRVSLTSFQTYPSGAGKYPGRPDGYQSASFFHAPIRPDPDSSTASCHPRSGKGRCHGEDTP